VTPALRERLDEHRYQRQSELYDLASLLETYDLTPDPGPIRDAAGQCLAAPRTARGDVPDAGKVYWGYSIDGLKLRLEPQRHCRPRAATADALVGVLSVQVQEYLPDEPEHIGTSFDHLRRLDTSFYCDAEVLVDDVSHRLRSAWHVDTHLHAHTASASIHPRFHFQVGGNELDEVDAAMRGVMLTETPRPAVAPLDGVLAIDFVLSNYCGVRWDELRTMDARYGRIRGPAMARYWGPYFQLIADALTGADPVPISGRAGLLRKRGLEAAAVRIGAAEAQSES
jgi:hypothetical protein